MSVVLKVENLSKAYQLGQIGTGTLSQDLHRWISMKLWKEDPFLKIGDTNQALKKSNNEVFWSLKNLNFDINQGDIVGVIGKNGAGKSTLLKILSQITTPSSGSVKIKGRVASLLEVGTGFHPELTGRENIFLNGAILGMRRHEISSKFDQIVDFSGVEKYIDTPVKRYSSGMYVRLAFAVAAHLDSEILIVDEVLAVGDAEFQLKCLNKMDNISKEFGRTILFVSHNLASIRKLCNIGILLTNGEIEVKDNITTVCEKYSQLTTLSSSKVLFENKIPRRGTGDIQFLTFEILNSKNESCNEFSMGDDIFMVFNIKNISAIKSCQIGIQVMSPDDLVIYHFINLDSRFSIELDSKISKFKVSLNDIRLYPNIYSLTISIADEFGSVEFDHMVSVISFKVTDGYSFTTRSLPIGTGLHLLNPKWEKCSI